MSDELPDYQPCEVELEFGDGSYRFKLTLKTIAELQEKCSAGIGTIYGRLLSGNFYDEDIHETVRLGLIGGGFEGPAARKLMDRYCDKWPREVWHKHAHAIMAACIHGYTPPLEEGQDDEKKTTN